EPPHPPPHHPRAQERTDAARPR
ncbi:MAG: hypothetical protein AVDCRST_MAG35-392, partial [uncultured Quadrisphaera sp.]